MRHIIQVPQYLETCVAKSRSADSSTEAPENAKQTLVFRDLLLESGLLKTQPIGSLTANANDYKKLDIQSGK